MYGDYDKVVEAFGEDLLEVPENLAVWRELLGLHNHIPWECVGQPEETQYYFYKLHQQGVKNLALDMFVKEWLEPMQKQHQIQDYFQKVEHQFNRPYDNHRTMPDWLWGKIAPAFNAIS